MTITTQQIETSAHAWHVPPSRAGQTVEIAYADGRNGHLYMRTTDRSDGSVRYAVADADSCGCEGECDHFEPWNREPSRYDWTDVVYRAYDTVTEWSGPVRTSVEAAERDAERHNAGCAEQGGYGSAIVATRDGSRLATLSGAPVWPPHGRSTGAVRWV